MIKRAVFIVFCILPCLAGQASARTVPLVLNTSALAPVSAPDRSGFLDLLYRELFARLGIAFEIQPLPAERALQNANAGIDDGEICRIAGLESTYPNLVHTTEPVMQYQMVVFSRERNFPVSGPESLLPYELGIVTGWKILEIALIDRLVGMGALNRLEIKGVRILSPPFLSGDWFLYLHKKHQALIPRIDAELRKMKQDGAYERIRQQALGRYEKPMAR